MGCGRRALLFKKRNQNQNFQHEILIDRFDGLKNPDDKKKKSTYKF